MTSRPSDLAAVVAIVLLTFSIWLPARAEDPASSSRLAVTITPYLWMPSIDLTAKVPVPGGGAATTSTTATPGDYFPHLNFAAMLEGEVRYDRFSVLMDFMYLESKPDEGPGQVVRPGVSSRPSGGIHPLQCQCSARKCRLDARRRVCGG